MGLQFSPEFLESVRMDPSLLCSNPSPFSQVTFLTARKSFADVSLQIDLLTIGQRVKTGSIVPQAEGYIQMVRGHQKRERGQNAKLSLRYFYSALSKFEECLHRNRNNKVFPPSLCLVSLAHVTL
jgi:hypothetical protein